MPRFPRLVPSVPRLVRLPFGQLSAFRLLRGGRVADAGRLPRYLGLFAIGAVCIWTPIGSYLSTAPLRFTSGATLILPGAGAAASVNLDRIGQASSFANSPYANSAVSPTETYKRLIAAERILEAASGSLDTSVRDFGKPRVELVDQTGLIHVSITGGTAEDAKARGDALIAAFFSEIEALRADEVMLRETSSGTAIEEYRQSVQATRDEISRLQRETGLISAAQFDTLVAETDALREEVAALGTRLQDKTEAVAALQRSLGTDPALAAAALKLHADTEFAALAEAMSEQAATLAQTRGQFGANHPKVRSARAAHSAAGSEAAARAARVTGLGPEAVSALDLSHVGSRAGLLSQLVTLEAERAGLAAEHAAMSDRLAEAEARRLALLEPAARLEDLQRDFAVSEAVFASAMAKSQTSKNDLYASYPLVQVLEDPSLPDAPSSPKRKLVLAAGIAATLFFLVGLALAWLRRPLIDGLLRSDRAQDAPAQFLVAAE